MSLSVRTLDPSSATALALIDELDRYLLTLYPPESNHLDSAAELSRPHVHFVGAFEDGQPIGCGAVKLLDGYSEIKRIYVRPKGRGRGVAAAILDELEGIALRASVATVRLETGTLQPEALRLFEQKGYARIGRFGGYPNDPLSVFMQKTLDLEDG